MRRPKKGQIANRNTRRSGPGNAPRLAPKVWDGMPETAPVMVGVSL